MTRVITPSRLHFGVLSLAAKGTHWPDRHGNAALPTRRFGSVGLMIQEPRVTVRVLPASDWSADGPRAARALEYAKRFAQSFAAPCAPHRIIVEECPPEHVGLGVGTQLGLAVARAMAVSAGRTMEIAELARRVGRGQRSGLGVHGFAHGGFLVDGGKGPAGGLAPLLARLRFPETWRILLVVPPTEIGLHGLREREIFARLAAAPRAAHRTDALCRLALLGMLPALHEADLPAFGEALFDFNARVGEAFAFAQGGIYASPLVAEVVVFLRSQGVAGVGQSSWGPTVFAVSDQGDQLRHLADAVIARFSLPTGSAFVIQACNDGARMAQGNL